MIGEVRIFILLLLFTAAPRYYEQKFTTPSIRLPAGAHPRYFFKILQDDQNFSGVSPAMFAIVHIIRFHINDVKLIHSCFCLVGLPYSGRRFSQFIQLSSFYKCTSTATCCRKDNYDGLLYRADGPYVAQKSPT